MTFGKYRNRTVGEVLEENPSYLLWADENVEFFSLSTQLATEAANRKSIKDVERKARQDDDYMRDYGMGIYDTTLFYND